MNKVYKIYKDTSTQKIQVEEFEIIKETPKLYFSADGSRFTKKNILVN